MLSESGLHDGGDTQRPLLRQSEGIIFLTGHKATRPRSGSGVLLPALASGDFPEPYLGASDSDSGTQSVVLLAQEGNGYE